MKRFISSLAVCTLAALPVAASAATFVGGEQYSRGTQDPVVGNLYANGQSISIASDVSGDVFAAGGTVIITGPVSGDIAAVGGTIQLLGPVNGDVRVGGGQITIAQHVGGDVLVAGGTVHLLSGAVLDGDVYVAGGQVIIDGTVGGSVHMVVGRSLAIGSGARIAGTLYYRSSQEAVIADGAHIGAISFEPRQPRFHSGTVGAKGILWALLAALTAVKMLAFLGAAALVMWRWHRWSLSEMQEADGAFWRSVGRGLVYAILVPIGAVLLLMSFVGSFAGLFALLVYAATGLAAKVLAGMFLGAWLSKVVAKRTVLHLTWTNALGGAILAQLLPIIPFIGMIVVVLFSLAMFGVLAGTVQKKLAAR
jgi:cytoskeletal protein CcmA (bactofilin family)